MHGRRRADDPTPGDTGHGRGEDVECCVDEKEDAGRVPPGPSRPLQHGNLCRGVATPVLSDLFSESESGKLPVETPRRLTPRLLYFAYVPLPTPVSLRLKSPTAMYRVIFVPPYDISLYKDIIDFTNLT